jgi:hypothetical protein
MTIIQKGEPMNDLISRQAAIDAINRYGSVWMEYTEIMSVDELAERALKASKQSMVKILHDLPSAQPKIGKWLDANICGELPVIVCDQCNTFFPIAFGEFHNFCPNCGAKMEGADDE